MNNKRFAIGVDVGGSHISCSTYKLHEKSLFVDTTYSITIDNKGSKDGILTNIVELVKINMSQITSSEFAGIGFAMPGPFDYENGIALFEGDNNKYINLYKVNIREELSKRLDINRDAIRFVNDAIAFALGEYFNGALRDYQKGLAITLGTGFGSAFLSEGIPVLIGTHVPEKAWFWNLPFENGIADEYFSTRGLISRFKSASKLNVEGVKQIAELYIKNNHAKNVFIDFGKKLAAFLAPWISDFGVESLIIGGNISKAFNLFKDEMSKSFQDKNIDIVIGASELGEEAAFIGAASLLHDDYYTQIKEQLKFM